MLYFFVKSVFSQNLGAYHYRKLFFLNSDTVTISAFSIQPTHFQILSDVPDSCFKLLWSKAQIVRTCPYKVLKIKYLTYPWDLDYDLGLKNNLRIKPQAYSVLSDKYEQRNEETVKSPSELKILKQEGEFMRGITVGSNKGVSLNSNLDLAFEAKMPNNIRLKALIRDKQMPIQSDGVTANLEELNQIYFEMIAPKISFQAGDYILENKNPLFVYQTKIKGIGLKTQNRFLKQETHFTKPKGIFKRQFLQAQNGNLIYRLSGKEGQSPIVVLSHSERIYINGILLQAGKKADYQIDYNTGEIKFTDKHQISNDMRIVAEFEYQDSETRLKVFHHSKISFQKTELNVNYIGEWQNRQNLINNLKDSALLAAVYQNTGLGDVLTIPNYSLQNYRNTDILYKLCDSIIGTQVFDSIFVFSNDSLQPLFRVQFTFVGQGNGNYVLMESNLNNPVYKWIEPLNGKMQGDYSSQKKIKIPQSKHKLNLYLRQKLNSHQYVDFNFTQNLLLQNRLSLVPNYQKSYIGEINFTDSLHNQNDTSQYHVFSLGVMRQSSHFNPMQPIFGVEFLRKWNLQDSALLNAFNKATIYSEWTKEGLYKQVIKFSTFQNKQNVLSKINWQSDVNLKNFEVQSEGDFSINVHSLENYFRQNGHILYSSKTGLYSLNIQNEYRKIEPDSLNFKFNNVGVAWQNDSTKSWLWNNVINYHIENSYNKKQWIASKIALQNQNELNQLKLLLQSQYFLQNQDSDKPDFVNFSFNNVFHLPKQWLNIRFKKESSAILEPIYRYRYQKVPAGQGYFKWIDYNKNNLEEDGEFEASDFFADAQYLRFRIPTSKTRQLFDNRQEINILFSASELFESKHLFSKYLSFINLQIQDNWHSKNTSSILTHLFYPDAKNKIYLFENSLLKLSYLLKKIELSYIQNQNENKQELSYGFESLNYRQKKFAVRFNLNKMIIMNLNLRKEFKKKQSEFLKAKNFDYSLNSFGFNPLINLSKQFSINILTDYQEFIGNFQTNFAQIIHSSLKLSYQMPKKSIALKLTYLNIRYQLPLNTALSYDILQTHLVGNNLDLFINLNISLTNLFSLRFSYQGRMAAKYLIHTGNIQIVANL